MSSVGCTTHRGLKGAVKAASLALAALTPTHFEWVNAGPELHTAPGHLELAYSAGAGAVRWAFVPWTDEGGASHEARGGVVSDGDCWWWIPDGHPLAEGAEKERW